MCRRSCRLGARILPPGSSRADSRTPGCSQSLAGPSPPRPHAAGSPAVCRRGLQGEQGGEGTDWTTGAKRWSLRWRRWGAALRTNALGLRSAPGQVRLAGPWGGALDQVSGLALKGHNAAHLWREEDRQQHLWKVKVRQKKKKHPTSGQNVKANCVERLPRKSACATLAFKVCKGCSCITGSYYGATGSSGKLGRKLEEWLSIAAVYVAWFMQWWRHRNGGNVRFVKWDACFHPTYILYLNWFLCKLANIFP